jgi:hypothetical protein
MSIDARFTTPIYVQIGTIAFGGAMTWADRAGNNLGYIRVLSQRERASVDKPTLFATHRAVMTCAVVPVYGQRLSIGTAYYMVKGVDAHNLSGGAFQSVDCEVVK